MSGGHQHRRPVDRVLAQDVLADHVDVGRPDPREPLLVGPVARGGDVVGEGVEPDVRDVVGSQGSGTPQSKFVRLIEKSWSPPRISDRTSFRRVSGSTADGVALVVLEQPVRVGREAEEVVLLLHHLDRPLVDRAQTPLQEVRLRVVELAGHAVEALVGIQVDVVPAVAVHLVK